jgi:hypothetical protein
MTEKIEARGAAGGQHNRPRGKVDLADDHPHVAHRPPNCSVPPGARLLAIVDDYESLVEALRNRANQIGASRASIDHAAGFPDGFAGRVLGPGFTKGLGVRSLPPILAALGVSLAVIGDTREAEAITIGGKRDEKRAGSRLNARRLRKDVLSYLRRIASRGGRARNAKMTKAERIEAARKAAFARWHRPNGEGAP